MGNRDTQAALHYHESTVHSEWSLRTNRHVLDWDNQPLSEPPKNPFRRVAGS